MSDESVRLALRIHDEVYTLYVTMAAQVKLV